MPAPGGNTGVITDQLKPLKDIKWPDHMVCTDMRTFNGNMRAQIAGIHSKSKGYKSLPIEYGFVFTSSYPNKDYIFVDRYPILPYWNRRFSHPFMEKLDSFEFTKAGATHTMDEKDDMHIHYVVEDAANSTTGYHMANDDIVRTY